MVWNHDLSTIDLDKLAAICPEHKLPAGCNYSDGEPGAGCAGDPPGFPSYFVRSVYTSRGNSPSRGASEVLCGRALPDNYEQIKRVYRAVYKPLPIDHPRTVAWMREQYRHMARCYVDPNGGEKRRHAGELAISGLGPYSLKTFRDDPRFSEEWRAKEKAQIEATNAEIQAAWARVAIPENHAAVVAIREFYPEHAPNLEWIANPPKGHANWWERYDHEPAPGEACPGDRSIRAAHTAAWCQFCGVGTGGEV